MSDLPHGPPVRVSPLIRVGRWGFLVTGLMYGAFHQNRLSKREVGVRADEAKLKVVRDAKLAQEKKINSDKEIKELETLLMPAAK